MAIINHQYELDVFANANQGISIRSFEWPENDNLICFNVESADKIVAAILEAKRQILENQNG